MIGVLKPDAGTVSLFVGVGSFCAFVLGVVCGRAQMRAASRIGALKLRSDNPKWASEVDELNRRYGMGQPKPSGKPTVAWRPPVRLLEAQQQRTGTDQPPAGPAGLGEEKPYPWRPWK